MHNIPPPGTMVMVNMSSPWDEQETKDWQDARVIEVLNTQFTFELADGTHGFRFYAHHGQTWIEGTI